MHSKHTEYSLQRNAPWPGLWHINPSMLFSWGSLRAFWKWSGIVLEGSGVIVRYLVAKGMLSK